MGVLSSLFRAAPATRPGPISDYWYTPFQPLDGSVHVTPDTVLTISTVYRAVSVLANTLAMLPLPVLERLPDEEGKQRATRHPNYRLLHDRPNRWQTSFAWRQMGMGHLVLRGNFYNRIVMDGAGRIEALVPLRPDRTEPVDQASDGAIIYDHVRQDGTRERLIGGEEVLHIHGFGSDGVRGISIVELMRRAASGAIQAESFASKLFSQAPLIRGFLKYPRPLQPDAKKTLEDSIARANSGPDNWHRVMVLENGMEWQSGDLLSPEDSQMIETREFSVPEFARYVGVPTVLLMHADKTALYANAEQFFQSFLNFDIAHWFVNWEQALNQTLFRDVEQDRFFAEFVREGLLRGDVKTRGEFYRVMIQLGVFTRNEVRVLEGRNKLPGLDAPLTPGPTADRLPDVGGVPDEVPEAAVSVPAARIPARVEAIVTEAAARMTRREVAELRKGAQKHADDAVAFERFAARFYERFTPDLAAALALPVAAVSAYTVDRQAQVVGKGATVLEAWAREGGAQILAQVWEGVEHVGA